MAWWGGSINTATVRSSNLPLSADMGQSKAQETIACLTKDAVREGKNKREGDSPDGQGGGGGYSGGYSSGRQTGGSYGGGSTQQSKTCDRIRGGAVKLIVSQVRASNPDPNTAPVRCCERPLCRF